MPAFSWAQKSKGDQLYQQARNILEEENFSKAAKTFLGSRDEYLKEKNYYRYFVATEAATIIYQDTGEGASAERILNEALTKIPNSPDDNEKLLAKVQGHLGYTYLYALNDLAKASAAYSKAIGIFDKVGDQKEAANQRINRAIVLQTQSRFDQAVIDLTEAIPQLADAKPEVMAGYHQLLGLNYYSLNRYDSAIDTFKHALDLVDGSENKELLASLHNDLGIAYQSQGAYREALEHLDLAKDLTEASFGKDADHYAQNLINLANAYEATGDLDRSLATFQEIATIYSQTPPTNDQDLVDVLLNLSRITNSLGMSEQSKTLVQSALELTQQKFGKNSLVEADVYTSMAASAFNNAEYDVSLNYNFKALSMLEANHYPGQETFAMIYNNIGQAYDELYEIDLALKFKNQAVEKYKSVFGAHHEAVAQATGNIGLTYEMAGDYPEALKFLTESLNIRLKIQAPDHEDVGTTHLNIGLVHLKNQHAPLAIESLAKALAIFDKYPKHVKKAMIYNRLGMANYLLGKKADAMAHYQKALVANNHNFNLESFEAIPAANDFLNYYEQLISLLGKADLLTKADQPNGFKRAEEHLQAADKILVDKALKLNNARDRLELIQATAFFTEAGMALADKLFRATRDPIHVEKAFYYSERNKANELYADVQRNKASSIARIPRKLIIRQRELTSRSNTLEQQIATATQARNQTLITQLKAQQFDLSKEYQQALDDMQRQSPRLAAATHQRALPGWQEVKKLLDPKTALISFVITDSSKYVLVGNSTSLVLKSLNKKTDLEKLVRGYRNFITFKRDDYKRMASQLYDEVWKPVEAALTALGGIENLIIMPDGALSYLPFETLGKEKMLVEQYTIRYALSGALMVSQGTPPLVRKPSFIALAPVFNDKETSFVNKSCQVMAEATQKTDTTSRAFTREGDYIAPLPATEKEVEQIHKIHTDKDLFSNFFTKENAKEELIKKGELAKYDYIHFATHGIANSQYPELSGLLLSQHENSEEDGILYTGEIMGLELKADLVTLSACETALGKKIEGEGVRGLTSAFLLAGANTVVVSLWKVADESTSIFMIEFYNQLIAGRDKAFALKQAKLKLLADPNYRHPYYWAPFIQVGMN